jgi:hypothetical protein
VKIGWDFWKIQTGANCTYGSVRVGDSWGGGLGWCLRVRLSTLSKGINEHIAALTVFDNASATGGSASLNFAGPSGLTW